MSRSTINSAGQITLTKELLAHLNVEQGDDVLIDKLPDRRVELRAWPKGKISDAFGILKDKTYRVLSIEEMSHFTAQGRESGR